MKEGKKVMKEKTKRKKFIIKSKRKHFAKSRSEKSVNLNLIMSFYFEQ